MAGNLRVVDSTPIRRRTQNSLRREGSEPGRLGRIFTAELGCSLHRRKLLRWYQDVLRREGLPVRCVKELWHTAASLLHERRLSAREMLDQPGHPDVRITLDIYTHVFDESRCRAADRMDGRSRRPHWATLKAE